MPADHTDVEDRLRRHFFDTTIHLPTHGPGLPGLAADVPRARWRRSRAIVSLAAAGIVIAGAAGIYTLMAPDREPPAAANQPDGAAAPSGVIDPGAMPSEYPIDREWLEYQPYTRELGDFWHRAANERQRRMAACMSARGFDYQPVVYADETVTDASWYRMLNPLNEAAARRWGYYPGTPEPLIDPNVASHDDPAFITALHGDEPPRTESPGCADLAYAALADIDDPGDGMVSTLRNQLVERLYSYDSTEQGIAAQQLWLDCMAASGYRIEARDEVSSQFLTAADDEGSLVRQPSAPELAVRLADLECDRQHDITVDRSTWQRAVFDQWMAETAVAWNEVGVALDRASNQLAALETDDLTSPPHGIAGARSEESGDDDLTIPLSIGEIVPPSPATLEVVWAAVQHLTQTCMADRGFDYDPRPSPGYERAWLDDRDRSLMTAERADAVGYHQVLPVYGPEEAAADELLAERTRDPAYLSALSAQSGEASELGCYLLALEVVDTNAELTSDDYQRLFGDAEQQVSDAVAADADYAAAVGRWSACMAAGGYPYLTPAEAFADPRWWTANEPPSDVEFATARHDAECRDDAGLNTAFRQAQRRAVADWISRNAATMDELRQIEASMLERAHAALAS